MSASTSTPTEPAPAPAPASSSTVAIPGGPAATINALADSVGTATLDDLDALNILSNPLISVKMTELRRADTGAARVRALIAEISLIVGIEASRTLDLQPVEGLKTPLGPFTGWKLAQRVGLAPILRAGIAMTEPMLTLFPEACVFHLGLYRDKVSFTPTEYYSKLPLAFEKHCDLVYLLDPVVATGGTACAAVNMLLDAGLEIGRIKLLAVIASMPGLQTILRECPGLEIYVAAVDQELTKEGYINPGLGDSGDRIFNTL